MSLRDAPTMPIARTLGAVFLAIAIVVVVASQHGAFVSITSLVTDPVRPDASLGIAGSYAARRTVLAIMTSVSPALSRHEGAIRAVATPLRPNVQAALK